MNPLSRSLLHFFLSAAVLVPVATLAGSVAPVGSLIAEGQEHARCFREEEALGCFLAAAKLDADNPVLLVAIAREYRHLMSDAKGAQAKVKHAQTALRYALRAAALAPGDAEAQLAPAITYGKLLPYIDDTEQRLETSMSIKAAVDKALALDPQNDIAWHILGRWHRGVAEVRGVKRLLGRLVYGNLPSSTFEDAAACFRKAIELKPDRLMHHVELGCVYQAMGKGAEAKRCIEHGLALAETEKDDPATKQAGRAALARLR
jgi:tetratricopeptide (TPR) repeat protein